MDKLSVVLGTIILVVLSLHLAVRIISKAYFRSKREHLRRLSDGQEKKREEGKQV